MKKYQIEMPNGWGPAECSKCSIRCEVGVDTDYDCPFVLSHAVEVKPTANADLVGALEKLADKYGKVCSITGDCCDSARQDVAGEIYSILSKYRPVKEVNPRRECVDKGIEEMMCGEVKEQGEAGLNGAEAVFGFMGWLTSRKEVSGPFSNIHDAGQAAKLADEFCKANKLKIENDRWHKILIHPKPTPAPPSSQRR